jgi:YD repeat-containing protein
MRRPLADGSSPRCWGSSAAPRAGPAGRRARPGRRARLPDRRSERHPLRFSRSSPTAGAATDGGDQELVRYGYTDGNLTEVVNSSGRPTRFGYDEQGRITSWTDTNERRFSYVLDDQDRCAHQSGAAGHLHSAFAYGPVAPDTGEHSTTVTDSRGRTTRRPIHRRCQVTAETDALGAVTRYRRDHTGHLLRHRHRGRAGRRHPCLLAPCRR